MEQIMEMLKTMQEKADANRKADQEKATANRKADQEKANADRTKDREQMLAMRQEMNANTKAMQEQADANTKAMQELQDIKSGQAKMIAAFKEKTDALIANIKTDRKETTACQYAMETSLKKIEPNSEEKETVVEQHDIPNEEVAVHSLRTCRSETAASQEDTEMKPDPEKMQSVEEHQKIPKEDTAVMPVGGLRKRRRDRNLAAGHRQKPKRRIRASCKSRRRLTVAGKKVTRRATVAWRKRNIFRRIVTQGNCGLRKRLVVTGKRMPAVQKWHEAEITVCRGKEKTSLHIEHRNDERKKKKGCGNSRNATVA
jgi:hypothetical protein